MGTPQYTMQETTTSLGADEVLARAKSFFVNRPSLYATFLDMDGPEFCSFRGQGGEELVIGTVALPDGAGTRVTGSSYLFDMQVSRFFTTLPTADAS